MNKTLEAITKASERLGPASASSLQKIVAASADGIVIIDETGTIRFTNPAAERLFGYADQELYGQPFGFPVLAGEQTEIDVVAKGGESRVAEMRVVKVEWEHRPAFLASLRDITRRKQIETQLGEYRDRLESLVSLRTRELERTKEKLRQEIQERDRAERAIFAEKERLQVTLDSIADAVLVTDERGIIVSANPVAQGLLSMKESDLNGCPMQSVLHIVDENTRRNMPNPLDVCLKYGKVTTLGDNALLLSANGAEYAIQDSAAPIRDHNGHIIGSVLVFRDVTATRKMEKTVQYQASHDALTGLVNRREFEQRLAHALDGFRNFGTIHTLCYLDLDQFKIVNDTAGHMAGDMLLRRIANMLTQLVRDRDTLARLGGDEFGLLLDNCPLSKAEDIAEGIVDKLRDFRFEWNERLFRIGVSVGIAPLSADIADSEQLMTRADIACYAAKEQGRNRVHVYSQSGDDSGRHHSEILRAAELREALEDNRFQLWLQPISPIVAQQARPPMCEVLLRLQDINGNVLPPNTFIPAAERYNIMSDIDRWVVSTLFNNFDAIVPRRESGVITINLSGNSLSDPGLLNYLEKTLDDTQVPARQICFEITETAAVQNLEHAQKVISALRARGCQFALDDFGSGLSSFTYLKRLPIDYLKISGDFVEGMLNNKVDHAFIEAIAGIGHTMGVKIIAEHVEYDELVEMLGDLGVDYIQGFITGKPRKLELG